MRSRSLSDEILARAVAFIDRRGGAAIRRGGRARGSARASKPRKPTYAVTSLTTNDFVQAVAASGVLATTGYFWFCVPFSILALGGATTRCVVNCGRTVNNNGYVLGTGGANSNMTFTYGPNASSPAASFTSADIGKIHLAYAVYDGRPRLYIRRAQVGTGGIVATAVLSTERLSIGRRLLTGSEIPATSIAIYGLMGGVGVAPSLADIQANHDACIAAEDLVPIDGQTSNLWSITQAVRGNNGVLPSTIPDAIGGQSLQLVGAPTLRTSQPGAWAA